MKPQSSTPTLSRAGALGLLLTVNVESDRPGGVVSARTTLENYSGVARLQRLTEALGLRPTWLLSWPAVQHPSRAIEQSLALGHAQVGAYLQPWITPPFSASEDRLRAVLPSALAASALEAKVAHLSAQIRARYGSVEVHRSFGYGLSGALLQALERLGYLADTSVAPGVDLSAQGGPDWRMAPRAPYFPDRQRPGRRGGSPVLQLPHSTLPPLWRWGRWATLARPLAPWAAPLGGPALSLDPSAHDLPSLQRMAHALQAQGLPYLQVELRSHELIAGQSEACPSAAHVEQLFSRLESFLRWALEALNVVPWTVSECVAQWLPSAG